MCYAGEAVDGRGAEGAVDEQAVVVTDKGKGYYADGLEDAVVDYEGATKLAFRFG